jgi:uncharacterized protein YcbK (DUF882 family)
VATVVVRRRISENFWEHEWACRCGCGFLVVDPETVRLAEAVRKVVGRPLVPTSVCRCRKHNALEGGKPNSRHLVGGAIDIRAFTDSERFELVAAGAQCGAGGIGIAKTFVHLDPRPRSEGRLWLYS